tara:strand:- start:972 stop:1559 length:588 start_codon:yes stop_codon:yes gene_type:complete
MGLLSKKNQGAVSGGGGGGGYLNPSKIQSGSSVRFALLTDQPLEFYECWGEDQEGKAKPFRFSDDPSPSEVEAEMGPNYERRLNREGTDVDPAKFAMAAPVYNFENGSVQVMSLTQKGLIREMDKLSQLEDYEDILAWDFVMEKEGTGLNTVYSLRIVPRKKATQKAIDDAWAKSCDDGFDINRLMTGGNPFKRD